MEEAIAELRSSGTEVLYVRANIADSVDRRNLIEAARSRFGGIHLLINNAGIGPKIRADILDATEESFDEVLGTNLRGPYFLTQSVVKWMIEQSKTEDNFWGCVINISSISADVASINRGEYCISKAGVAMATKLWATRLGEFNIPVYEVRPGIIKTDMTSALPSSLVGAVPKMLAWLWQHWRAAIFLILLDPYSRLTADCRCRDSKR